MRKRILVVSPIPTHPAISGNSCRINTFVLSLKKMGHEVHFLHIERERGDSDAMKKAWGDSYHSVPYRVLPRSLSQKIKRKLNSLIDNESRYRYSLDEWWDNSTNDILSQLQIQFKFEVVIVEYIFFSKALSFFPSDILKIIDTHDVFSDRHKLYLENKKKPVWYSTSQKEEKKALNRANLIIAIQDLENAFFSKLTRKPVITIGHVVPLIPPVTRKKTYRILYIASHNPINKDAIEWFIKNVFAMIKITIPQAELHIAGKICDCISDGNGIVKLGIVQELSELYKQCDVVINPMLYGTGLKIKNIEALGYSKVLVTGPVGTTGIEDGAGTAYLVADGAEQFSDSVIKTLTDTELNESLSQHAYEYASDWNEKTLSKLEKALANPPSH